MTRLVRRLTQYAATCLFTAALASTSNAQTAMFRGDPSRRGVAVGTAAPSLQHVAWKFRTGGRIISTPLVVGNTVYVGSNDGALYAVDRTEGTQRWKFQSRGAVHSSPAFSNGLIYFASLDGNVYAVDTTGVERWKFATRGERRFTAPGIHGIQPRTENMPDPFDMLMSSPAVANGVVYIGSGDHHVYALDARTGALRWSHRTGNVVHASPAVVDNVVFIGSFDRNMYALDATSGRELWRHTTGNDTVIYNQIGITSSAAVANGTVYFGCRDGHFYAVDAKSGALRWRHSNSGGWVIASPTVHDGVVYFPTSDGTRFKALDAATGAVKWNVVNKSISFSSPILVGNSIFFGSSDGWLRALDAATGAVRAEFQSDGSRANGARFTDTTGRMNTGPMFPERTLDGIFIGIHTMFTLGSMISSPVVANGVLYIGSTDGTLYALR